MNICSNGQSLNLTNQNGNVNVLGNHNTINISRSQIIVTVNGNNNIFTIKHTSATFNLNGNNNIIRAADCTLSYGFNGNGNIVQDEGHSTFNILFSNGYRNHYPGSDELDQPNQQHQQRDNANRARQPLRANRQLQYNHFPNYQQQQQQQQQRQQHQQQRQQQQQQQQQQRQQQQQQQRGGLRNRNRNTNNQNPFPNNPHNPFVNNVQNSFPNNGQNPFVNNGFNPFNMGFGGYLGQNLMRGFAQSINGLFSNPLNRNNRQFQFVNQPHNYNYQMYEPEEAYGGFTVVQHVQEEVQQERGLDSDELSMLPCTKHKGKDGKCTICLCEIQVGENQTFLMCFHPFHSECIGDWLRKTAKCPICQFDVKRHLRGEQ